MKRRQYLTPHVVVSDTAQPLKRIAHSDATIREDWLQELLYTNPALLGVDEIEEGIGTLIPLARELPTPSGPVDLAFVTPAGYLVLVETKLFRNPEARRKVVAQIIDYATAMSGWSYTNLCEAVGTARRRRNERMPSADVGAAGPPDVLSFLASEHEDYDESRFADAVSENLAKGRFLLLIAGDGIQSGAEDLANTVAYAPHLRYRLALIEMALYHVPGGRDEIFIQPRLLTRTAEVVRAVIELREPLTSSQVVVTLPKNEAVRAVNLTESAFYDEVRANVGTEVESFARWFIAQVSERPDLRLTWSRFGPALWWDDEEGGTQAQLLRLRSQGEISGTQMLPSYLARHGLPPAIGKEFQEGLIGLLKGAVLTRRGAKGYQHVMDAKGGHAKFTPLSNKREEFWSLITKTVDALANAVTTRSDGEPA
ncbi:MAG: hypothetical protein HUU18_06060 [Phycisphaerales bacterium]|nr:hypothetical protein [Phycisphaerales bacterium]